METKTKKPIDPQILEIRKAYRDEVKALRKRKKSESVLKTIIAKQLDRLTLEDKQKLRDTLTTMVSPDPTV